MATATATEMELLNPQQTRDAWMAKDADGFDGSAGDLSTSDDGILGVERTVRVVDGAGDC